MKVIVEGTSGEFLDLAELITYGRTYRSSLTAPKNPNTSRRDVRDFQARDDVPNRYREEGAQ